MLYRLISTGQTVLANRVRFNVNNILYLYGTVITYDVITEQPNDSPSVGDYVQMPMSEFELLPAKTKINMEFVQSSRAHLYPIEMLMENQVYSLFREYYTCKEDLIDGRYVQVGDMLVPPSGMIKQIDKKSYYG